MGRKMLKRFVLSALAVCMSLTQITVTKVNAVTANTISDVQIMAQQMDRSSDGYSVLAGGYIKPTTVYTYETPSSSDTSNLVSVNADNQTVTVKAYTDSDGNFWSPAHACVSEEGYEDVIFDLTDGFGSFGELREGRTGNNYVIKVYYGLSKQLSVDLQNKIINAPHYLNTGVAVLEELYSYSGSLENLATTYITYLKMLVDGVNVSGLGLIQLDKTDTVTRAAINALYNEIQNNASKRLILTDYINAYVASDAKQVYLVNNAEKVHDQLVKTQTNLDAITNSEKVNTFISTVELIANAKEDEQLINDVDKLKLLRTLIVDLNNNLKSAVSEEKWGIVNYDYSDILTETGKSAAFSKMLVDGLNTTECEMVLDYITILFDEVTASVNRYKVVASIEADVIELNDTTNKLTTLSGVSTNLYINDGATLDAIINAAEDSELVESPLFKVFIIYAIFLEQSTLLNQG